MPEQSIEAIAGFRKAKSKGDRCYGYGTAGCRE
jgi:hypothetical protein